MSSDPSHTNHQHAAHANSHNIDQPDSNTEQPSEGFFNVVSELSHQSDPNHGLPPENYMQPSKNMAGVSDVGNLATATIALNNTDDSFRSTDPIEASRNPSINSKNDNSSPYPHKDPISPASPTPPTADDDMDITKLAAEAYDDVQPDKHRTHPEELASWLSYITFYWFNPYISYGFRNTIKVDDIPEMRSDMKATYLTAAFMAAYERQKLKNPENPNVFWALNSAFGYRFWIAGMCQNVSNGIGFITPNLLNWLITYIAEDRYLAPDQQRPGYYGYMLAFGMFLCAVTTIALTNEFYRSALTTGIKIRAALIGAIYQKSLKLSPRARATMSSGQITNMMSVDCTKLDLTCQFFHFSWTTVIQVIISIGLLVWQLGVSALPGIAIMLFFMPMQGVIMRYLGKARAAAAKKTDHRLKVMNEILQGIRVIKVYAWENSFLAKMVDARAAEMKYVKTASSIRGLNGVLNTGLPAIMNFLPFMTLGLISIHNGNQGHLNAADVFTGLVYLNMIRIPVIILPITFSMAADARVAFDRISKFLMADELNEQFQSRIVEDSPYAVQIDAADFTWDVSADKIADPTMKENIKRSSSQASNATDGTADGQQRRDSEYVFELKDINLKIPRGQLTAVIGGVGSGKSSLLQGLLGEMKRTKGTVTLCGTMGYCPQQAWIMNSTLRNNVLFGLPYDEARYQAAIKACALESDLKVLPAGDQTEIGERGINLSGGQKQRTSLARSVYFNADTVLLDDILSAVDSHVSKYLFSECIDGALQGKTRVLVTHQLQYMPRVDYIVHMRDGCIVEQGTYSELMNKHTEFSQLMKDFGGIGEQDEEATADSLEQQEQQSKQTATMLKRQSSDKSTAGSTADGPTVEKKEAKTPSGVLMTQEDKASGSLGWPVYRFYMRANGGWPVFLVFLFWVSGTLASRFLTDWWLTRWTAYTYNFDVSYYIGIYAALTGAQFVCGTFYNVLLANRSVVAATKMHNQSFNVVMKAPMSFFDTTPIGRIMNRFSRDQDTIDNLLMMENFRMLFYWLGTALGTLIMIGIFNPWFAIAIPVIIGFFYVTQLYYRRTSRELKRMDAIYRSPLFAHFSETLSGLPTIRAYRRQLTFIAENQTRMDTNDRPYFMLQCSSRWLGERLEFMGAIVTFLAAAIGTATRDSINPGVVGLSLSYAFSLTQVLSFMVRNIVDTENNMNSVERTKSYTEAVEQEAAAELESDKQLPPNWPQQGCMELQGMSLRYRDGLPLVLKQLSATVRGGERIGVVGRTGAGKSSMMLALFRLVELAEGAIVIDGVDISKIGLKTLRSKLSMMPQDPICYSGTIRSNLDPFTQYTDVQLWQALEKAYLKEAIEKQDLKLEAPVTEGGENFSVGQRCQICLARAMLRNASILVMDEATASIDLETDSLIQQSIRDHFKCTVLTIAHRLNTIMDYDRVMVLSYGRIVEFDTPANLCNNPDSIFSSMLAETGKENEQMLRGIAMQAQQQRLHGSAHADIVADKQVDNPEDSHAPMHNMHPDQRLHETQHHNH